MTTYGQKKEQLKEAADTAPRSEDYGKGVATIGGAAASGGLMSRFLPANSSFAQRHPTLRGSLYAGGLSAGGLLTRTGVDALRKRSTEKEASVEYRGRTFPGYNQPIDSDRPEKKKMVLAKKGDQIKLIHFGQKGYKHNYSEAAKKNYLSRSAGIRGKDGSLTANDKLSANYWARRELWPKNEPADGSARSREKRASDDDFGHKAELAGLGVLAAPAAAHLAAKVPGLRKAAKPLSELLHKNPSIEHAVEVGGLGILAAPSVKALLSSNSGHKKVAAPRYLKQLRELVASGDLTGAQALAGRLDAAGVLKKTEKGSIIRILGSGAEGPAALTVGSTDSPVPLSVMKMFDRGGALFDQRSLGEKFNMLRRARAANNPEIARLYSPRIRRGAGGTPFYQTEFVPGNGSDFASVAAPSVYGKGSTEFTQQFALPTGSSFGMGAKKMLGDVVGNPGNTVNGPTGKKIIDFLPTTAENAQRTFSASSPGFNRMQRWLGLPENTTVPSVNAANERAMGMMSRLMDPQFQERANKMTKPILAERMRTLFDLPNLASSDFTDLGIRRADQRRTLRGL